MHHPTSESRQPELVELERAEQRQLRLSADSYGQRADWRKTIGRGDWWIALGVYAILCGITTGAPLARLARSPFNNNSLIHESDGVHTLCGDP